MNIKLKPYETVTRPDSGNCSKRINWPRRVMGIQRKHYTFYLFIFINLWYLLGKEFPQILPVVSVPRQSIPILTTVDQIINTTIFQKKH